VSSERFRPGRVPEQRPGQAGGTRARNRRERTESLCAAALEVFLEQGLEAATVDAITREAGIAKGSFYRYFEDKAQLVEAILAPLAGAFDGALRAAEEALERARGPEQLAAVYQQLAERLATALVQSPAVARLYLQERRAPGRGARRPIRLLSERIEQGALELTVVAHRRALLKPLPPPVTALAVVGAVEGLLFAALEGVPLGNPPEVVAALVTMMLEGVRA
jgi:AcrR family transcriptional regulator